MEVILHHEGTKRESAEFQLVLLMNLPNLDDDTTESYYIGVDVGTGSVRACLVNSEGAILRSAEQAIGREELKKDHITQSSREIWGAVCLCVKSVVGQSSIDARRVLGIGFDATCSLVVLDGEKGCPIGVGPNFENDEQNIIMWMDHRAIEETRIVNSYKDSSLKYVGGAVSIEMEIPKILWLKKNMPENKFVHCEFFDLPDFLTYKATGRKARSLCSVVCKQCFLPPSTEESSKGWSRSFFEGIGLSQLVNNNFRQLGNRTDTSDCNAGGPFLSAGCCVGTLSQQAAGELGLTTNCAVGSGLIDAYSGWLGTVTTKTKLDPIDQQLSGECIYHRLAAIAGTSTCLIKLSKTPIFAKGVWGPYGDVMGRGTWCIEGGQSYTGALLAHIVSTHPSHKKLHELSTEAGISDHEYIVQHLAQMKGRRKARSILALAKNFFFYGDYFGNRSPLSDPSMCGAVIGLSTDTSIDDLCIKYLGACEFISLQMRQIIETMTAAGHKVNAIYMSGGQCRNRLLTELMANCTGLPIVITQNGESSVMFGAAILGAAASAHRNLGKDREDNGVLFSDSILFKIAERMGREGEVIECSPVNDPDRILLDVKYKIFLDMIKKQIEYRSMIEDVEQNLEIPVLQ